MLSGSKLLFVAPHSDDEVACGGTIARFVEEGKEIYYAVFSFAEESVPKGFPKDILKREMEKSLKVLGISDKNIFEYNFPVRHFPEHRQEILEILVDLRKKIDPSMVILPSSLDFHQDHKIIREEGRRAFSRHCTILGYETTLNTLPLTGLCHIKIQSRHLAKKVEASKCYKSQQWRRAWDGDIMLGLAKARGLQMHETLGEAYEVTQIKVI